MVNRILATLIVVLAASSRAAAQAPAPAPTPPVTMDLAGPRVGATFLSNGVLNSWRGGSGRGIEIGSVISQFGWQKEKRFYTGTNGLSAVTEWVVLFGGIDQGIVIPSFSWLVGMRTIKGVEFAVGPNISPAGAALAAAAGVTFRSGNLNFPVNVAVVPSRTGLRVSMLAGFNARKR